MFESLQRAWKGDDPTMSVLRASFAVASASAAALAPVHLGAGPARPVAAPVRRGNAPAGFQPILAIKNNGLGFRASIASCASMAARACLTACVG